jgi:iron complex transport system substrate-binding protein
MPARSRFARPAVRPGWPLGAIALVLALVLGACSTAAPVATIPPEATGSSVPSATGTPTAPPTPTAATAFPLRLVDDEGATVEIPAQPARIVSLTPANTEILFAIGVGDRVVATTDFDDFPIEAIPLPDVASYGSVDIEAVVGLEADLVIAGGNAFTPEDAIARLRQLGIPVLVVYAPTVEAVFADIELVGRAVGRATEAAELAAEMRAEFAAVAAANANLPRPRVFYELDATGAIYGPADDSFLADMIELAGGDPITTGSPSVFEISIEVLIQADPEIILLGDAAYGVTAEQVTARPGWSVMTAVRNGDIRPVSDIEITRPGPRLGLGLRNLAAAIHPPAGPAS